VKKPQIPATRDFQFIGGNLALDFINTVGNRPRNTHEHFTSASELERWARLAGLLPWRQKVSFRPSELRNWISVREELYDLFRPVASGAQIPPGGLRQLNGRLKQIAAFRQISRRGKEFAWVWGEDMARASRLLAPVLWDAAELLTSSKFVRIRECEDRSCGWLFLDRSQARKRRWCSMADCGNRYKARRFYLRKKKSASGGRKLPQVR
jgi:predicted RNA-binding Zn ribbon-like protein